MSKFVTMRVINKLAAAVGGEARATELYNAAGIDFTVNRAGHQKTMALQHEVLQAEYDRLAALNQLPKQSAGVAPKPAPVALVSSDITPVVKTPARAAIATPAVSLRPQAKVDSEGRPSLGQLNQIATAVFGREFSPIVNRADQNAMMAEVEKLCFAAHLELPGMNAAALQQAVHRLDAGQMVGALATERNARQAKVDAILAGQTNSTVYLAMDAERRREFAESGHKLTRSEFDALTPRAKTEYARNGGRLRDDEPESERRAEQASAKGKSISRAAWEALNPMAQAAWCRTGGKLHD